MTGPGRRPMIAGSHTFMKEGLTTLRRRNMARSARRTSYSGVWIRRVFTPRSSSREGILYRGVAMTAGHTVVTPTP